MKIFGWASSRGGAGKLRIGMPLWALGKMGHDTTAFLTLDGDLPEDLDVLVGQLVCTPERADVWLDAAAKPGRAMAMIYELDDDIWNVHSTNFGGAALREREMQVRAERSIAAADAVTVTTNYLAEVIGKFNPNVHVLPNCINESLLQAERPRNERITVGWAGGSSHEQDFAAVGPDLRWFFRNNPDVDLHIIGSNFAAYAGRPDARHTPWNQDVNAYLASIDFDIGIAPLAYHPFNRSKSDLKFMEYAALGIPVVASNYGPYAESIEHGVTGFLVNHPHEWGKYLRALVNDEDMRGEIGANAKQWAATRTIHRNAGRWEQVYASVYAGRLTALLAQTLQTRGATL